VACGFLWEQTLCNWAVAAMDEAHTEVTLDVQPSASATLALGAVFKHRLLWIIYVLQ